VMNEEASVVTAILLATTTVLVEIHILDEVLTKRKQGARMVTRATRMAVIISQLREGWPCVPVPTQKELTSTQMARGGYNDAQYARGGGNEESEKRGVEVLKKRVVKRAGHRQVNIVERPSGALWRLRGGTAATSPWSVGLEQVKRQQSEEHQRATDIAKGAGSMADGTTFEKLT
ncbi:hypothetical protein THAOC_12044, partial [Thalassiosira oceanica]